MCSHALPPADPGHLIIGNDGGVYASRDGGKAWEHMAIPIGQFYTVIVDSSLTPYQVCGGLQDNGVDRKSTRLNSSHTVISYAVFCLKKKKKKHNKKEI